MTSEEYDLFDQSLQRCTQTDGFLDRFYGLFLAASPEIAAKFRNTDFGKQKRLLKASFYMMMLAAECTPEKQPLFEQIARRHARDRQDIPPYMYEIWLDCLLRAVSEFDDQYDETVERLWRAVLEPGIRYMQSKYEPE